MEKDIELTNLKEQYDLSLNTIEEISTEQSGLKQQLKNYDDRIKNIIKENKNQLHESGQEIRQHKEEIIILKNKIKKKHSIENYKQKEEYTLQVQELSQKVFSLETEKSNLNLMMETMAKTIEENNTRLRHEVSLTDFEESSTLDFTQNGLNLKLADSCIRLSFNDTTLLEELKEYEEKEEETHMDMHTSGAAVASMEVMPTTGNQFNDSIEHNTTTIVKNDQSSNLEIHNLSNKTQTPINENDTDSKTKSYLSITSDYDDNSFSLFKVPNKGKEDGSKTAENKTLTNPKSESTEIQTETNNNKIIIPGKHKNDHLTDRSIIPTPLTPEIQILVPRDLKTIPNYNRYIKHNKETQPMSENLQNQKDNVDLLEVLLDEIFLCKDTLISFGNQINELGLLYTENKTEIEKNKKY